MRRLNPKMDQTLKQHEVNISEHEKLIDKHEVKLEDIQQDLIDLKVRLGIKDKTNGQVVAYQEQLVTAQMQEREERKEQDEALKEDIRKLDERTWYILTGVVLSILLEIGFMLFKGG